MNAPRPSASRMPNAAPANCVQYASSVQSGSIRGVLLRVDQLDQVGAELVADGAQLRTADPERSARMSGVYESENVILSQYIRNAMLTTLTTRPGAALWQTPKIHLSNLSTFAPAPTATLASLTANETAFSGYTAATVTAVVPVNVSPTVQALIATVVFEATTASPFVPDTIWAYWGDDGTNWLVAEKFANGASIPIASAGDYCQIDLIFPLGTPQAA